MEALVVLWGTFEELQRSGDLRRPCPSCTETDVIKLDVRLSSHSSVFTLSVSGAYVRSHWVLWEHAVHHENLRVRRHQQIKISSAHMSYPQWSPSRLRSRRGGTTKLFSAIWRSGCGRIIFLSPGISMHCKRGKLKGVLIFKRWHKNIGRFVYLFIFNRWCDARRTTRKYANWNTLFEMIASRSERGGGWNWSVSKPEPVSVRFHCRI